MRPNSEALSLRKWEVHPAALRRAQGSHFMREADIRTTVKSHISTLEAFLPKAVSGMEEIQRQHPGHDNRPLQPDKVLLCLDQMSRPSLAQFRHTIHTPRKDAERRKCQRKQESSESPTLSERFVPLVQSLLADSQDSTPRANRKVNREDDEDE
jgi:hypothetical protein